MRTVVLDIETVAGELDHVQQAYLTRDGESLDKAALWPVTGRVCCIGMLNPDTGDTDMILTDEELMLHRFWDLVRGYDRVVTFNGRSFDLPFLVMRSAIKGVGMIRHDLLGYRYSSHPHCDLMDQLTWYGATRRFSLDMYCRAFGIPSPKENGSGADVGEMFADGRHQEIKDYCLRDLQATATLYKIWLDGIAPHGK